MEGWDVDRAKAAVQDIEQGKRAKFDKSTDSMPTVLKEVVSSEIPAPRRKRALTGGDTLSLFKGPRPT